MYRRKFLGDLGKAAFAAWLGADFLSEALATSRNNNVVAPTSTRKGILNLHLQASQLNEMGHFYRDVIGFPIEKSGGTLIFKTGKTTIHFEESDIRQQHYYHIAWAIPENKFALAKAWLAKRTPLLKHPDGRDEFHFRRVNRHAVYFADPEGNILEFIARHNLKDGAEGPFGLRDVLYVNHVGLVVDDMTTRIDQLCTNLDLGLTAPPTPNFAKIGDEHRHLVLVPRNRMWLPEGVKPARVFKTDIVLHGSPARDYEFDVLPYRVAIEE